MDTIKRSEDIFGSRMAYLGHFVLTLSRTGQPCDVTFFKRKPTINVKIDPQIHLALV